MVPGQRRFPVATLILACLFIAQASRPAEAEVTITDIGTINGRSSAASGVNHAGEVAGSSYFSGTIGTANGPGSDPFLTHGILYSGGVLHDLGAIEGAVGCSPLGCQSEAFGVNDHDWVVGWTDNGVNGTLAYLWLPSAVPGGNAGLNALPALSPTEGSAALAVNGSGQMVGFSKHDGFLPRAILWQLTAGGPALTDLGTLRPDNSGSAIAEGINEAGQIVGSANDASTGAQAFLYLPTPAYGLPAGMNNLTAPAGEFTAEATCVNDRGEVAGVINGAQLFVWLPAAAHGLPAGLSRPAPDRNMLSFVPTAISGGGLIVGQATLVTNPGSNSQVVTKAAAWQNGGWIYFDDLLPTGSAWDLVVATSVTHSDKTTRIAGVGVLSGVTDVNGLTPVIHGFVLNVTCPGDLNGDGVVDKADLAIQRQQFGQSVPPNTGGDLNGDGVVDQQDVVLLTSELGDECLGSSIGTASPVTQNTAPTSLGHAGTPLPAVAGVPGLDLASLLRPYDIASANALVDRVVQRARGAAPAGVTVPVAPARALSAGPLPYRGGALQVTLALGDGLGPDTDIAIYDLVGRRVRTLSGAAHDGERSLVWDGRDARGAAVGNGVYFLRAIGASRVAQLKFAVIR